MVDGGLRKLFKDNAPGFWQAIETGGTGKGIPDSHYLYRGVAGWVEFKQTDRVDIGLRTEQVGWINRYVRYGGLCHIIVRHKHEGGPRKGPPIDEIVVYDGAAVRDLAIHGLAYPPMYRTLTKEIDFRLLLDRLIHGRQTLD